MSSSWILDLSWANGTTTMTVVGGRSYFYTMTEAEFEAWYNSDSWGSYWHQFVSTG